MKSPDMLIYLYVFLPIICLAINVLCQIYICRYITGFSLLRSVFIGFALGICCLVFAELYFLNQAYLSLSGNIASIFVNVITYIALGYGYFHFINLGETGRRIRILRELYESKAGLSQKEIMERYNVKEILEKRINRLINNGQIVYKDGKYYIASPIMLLIVRTTDLMKIILTGRKSEFD